MQAQARDQRTEADADPARPGYAGARDLRDNAANAQVAARSVAVRQLIARSVLHGAALRTLLAAGR